MFTLRSSTTYMYMCIVINAYLYMYLHVFLFYPGPSLCTRVINGIGGFFYSLGSFLYLFFAVVVLCDIPIFSR